MNAPSKICYDQTPKNPYFIWLEFESSQTGETVRYATRVHSATENDAFNEALRKFRTRFKNSGTKLLFWATRQRFWVDA